MPTSRYRPSERSYPETLPPVEHPAADHVRKVQDKGRVDFRGQRLCVPQAFRGYPVALRLLDADGRWALYFTTNASPKSTCEPCRDHPDEVSDISPNTCLTCPRSVQRVGGWDY